MSAAALMAREMGFIVDGCDIEKDTAYLKKIKKSSVKVFYGHDKKHLEGCDILVVSPAILYVNKNHPEFTYGKSEKEVLTWQEFVGKYLQEDKEVIAISGTHGKSTTTALAALILSNAELDPNVIVGATIPDWSSNFRVGKSKIFVIEADEFFDNFLNYSPNVIILNNIEFDHPDYFKNEESVLKSFKSFVKKMKRNGTLIVNLDSDGVIKLLKSLGTHNLSKLSLYGYTLKQVPEFSTKILVYGSVTQKSPDSTNFLVYSNELGLDDGFKLKIPGDHNVSNALGVITLAKILNIDLEIVKSVLITFDGVGRRLELIGEKKGVKVFDDYAHHPTAIRATISALRQKYPSQKIWTIVEPHSFSRTKALLKNYEGVFESADEVIIGPIFKARDVKTFGVNGASIVKAAKHKSAIYLDNLGKIVRFIKKNVKVDDVILVMGAGKSYLWSREILRKL